MVYSSVFCFCLVCQLSLGLYNYCYLFINFSKMSVLTDSYSHSTIRNPQSYTTTRLLSLLADCLNMNSSFTYSNFIIVFIRYLFLCKSRHRFRMMQQHWSNRSENEIVRSKTKRPQLQTSFCNNPQVLGYSLEQLIFF